MEKKIKMGFVLAFVLGCLVAYIPMIVSQPPEQSHPADQIKPGATGTFGTGDYTFPDNLNVGNDFICTGCVGSSDINSAQVQERVSGTCAAGSSIRVVNQDGTVSCETDDGGIAACSDCDANFVNEGQANSITSGMIVDGTVGSSDINSAQVQERVSGTCAAGSSIRVVNQDGTVSCETDDVGITSESDTLQTVTDRGTSTTHAVTLDSNGDQTTTIGGRLKVGDAIYGAPSIRYVDIFGPGTGADNQYHTVECPDYHAMVYFEVEATSRWDGWVTIYCVYLGDLLTTTSAWTARTAPDDDTFHSRSCPAGTIATGWSAYATSYLDYGLALKCTDLASGVSRSGTIAAIRYPECENWDDTIHHAFCPTGTYAYYFYVYAGSYFDYCMGMTCVHLTW